MDKYSIKDITRAEKSNMAKTQKIFRKEIKIYEQGISLLYDFFVFCLDNDSFATTEPISTLIMIHPRLMRTLSSIYILACKGYYHEAKILTRSWFETIGILEHFNSHPFEWKIWMLDNRSKEKPSALFRQGFTFSNNDLDIDKRLFQLKQMYNDAVHNNPASFYDILENIDCNSLSIDIPMVPMFSEERFKSSLLPYFPLLLLLHYASLFKKEMDKEQHELILDYIVESNILLRHYGGLQLSDTDTAILNNLLKDNTKDKI